jgi:hypothetical protein
MKHPSAFWIRFFEESGRKSTAIANAGSLLDPQAACLFPACVYLWWDQQGVGGLLCLSIASGVITIPSMDFKGVSRCSVSLLTYLITTWNILSKCDIKTWIYLHFFQIYIEFSQTYESKQGDLWIIHCHKQWASLSWMDVTNQWKHNLASFKAKYQDFVSLQFTAIHKVSHFKTAGKDGCCLCHSATRSTHTYLKTWQFILLRIPTCIVNW